MKYYLIVGEASGDLHASHLMAALKAEDPQADFRFFGGDLMAAVGGTMVKHYKELAYMGFIPVLLHLRTIFSNMIRSVPMKEKICSRKRWRLRLKENLFWLFFRQAEENPSHSSSRL